MPSILCVAAHPDDESFGPGGALARYASEGVAVHLLTFTRGQRGVRPKHIETPEALGRLRQYELLAATKVLGVRDLQLLDYMDGELDRAPLDELAGHVSNAIERAAADTVVTFGPTGITRHGDHIAAHRATMAAVERSAHPPAVFYYAVAGQFADQMQVEGVEREPTHYLDISDHFDTKLAALACHSSQDDSREFFMMLSERHLTQEWFHRALPAPEPGRTYTDLFE